MTYLDNNRFFERVRENKRRNESAGSFVVTCLLGLLLLAAMIGGCAVNYQVQRARFPDAPAWTCFFK